MRGVVLTVLLSLSVGYVLFLAVFPTVAFPASGEAPFPIVFVVLAASALIVGFAADDLLLGITAAVVSLAGGALVAGLMGLFPIVEGLYLVDPASLAGFLVHYGFVFLILAFTVNIVGVIVGYGLKERFVVQRPQTFAESVAMHRK